MISLVPLHLTEIKNAVLASVGFSNYIADWRHLRNFIHQNCGRENSESFTLRVLITFDLAINFEVCV
jgi:hypothetical protein